MTALAVPPGTEHAEHAAVIALIGSAEDHQLIRTPFAEHLRATVAAVTELRAGVQSPAHEKMTQTWRGQSLRLLAEVRRDWEPDVHGRPVWDGEIGQVVRYLAARPPRLDLEQAWGLLCESMSDLLGLADRSIDPADRLPGPGSVDDKRQLLENDAEADAERAVAFLLAVDRSAVVR